MATIICLLLLCILPESPIWYVMKKRYDDGKKSLAWLRGWTNEEHIEKEYMELLMNFENENQEGNTRGYLQSMKGFCRREVYLPSLLILYIFFLAQFTAVSSISVYAIFTFASLKVPINEYYATIIFGMTHIIGNLTLTSFIATLGRRLMIFLSLLGLSLCLIITAIYLYMYNILDLEFHEAVTSTSTTQHWVPFIFVLLASLSANSCLAVMPWILIGEMFPDNVRATASGLTAAVGYMICAMAHKIYPRVVGLATFPGAFLIYSTVALSGLVILYFVFPETEGRTLQEVVDHFKGVSKIDNKFRRNVKNKS